MRKILLAALFVTAGTVSTFAQTASADNSLILNLNDISIEPSGDDWAFYENQEDGTLYIDFAVFNAKMVWLDVKLQGSDDILKTESLLDLPDDAMYALDIHQFPKGNYVLELNTVHSIIRKEITVN